MSDRFYEQRQQDERRLQEQSEPAVQPERPRITLSELQGARRGEGVDRLLDRGSRRWRRVPLDVWEPL